jgi:ATP-dependent Lhr-like helicase
MTPSVLDAFLPPVAAWFRRELGVPTLPQERGWPVIAAGQHALILAPTGSGKTLAAFLACLDALWRDPGPAKQVQVLYISPLKALNVDIQRNLQRPLAGVRQAAEAMGIPLPELRVAVRTGDTSSAERQKLVRQPPHVLITTPESLHILLTSQARNTLRSVRYCIVDEIHALCPNKRGTFLALLLERLAELNREREFVRIGLSATQRPLDEVARYLGGRDDAGRERPVTIVDAGLRKQMDLRVVHPVGQFGPLPEKSVWPAIYRLLHDEVRRHRSTIIFANNRRTVERVTNHLNDLAAQPGGEADGQDGTAAAGQLLAFAHHGSLSLENRQGIEAKLKAGHLPAVVATASLELGIDMGDVELVCQIESPGNIARSLQRVGRAGHLVGQTSQGRLIPKTLPDLMEQAVLAREMVAGRVEELHVPTNALDVLAQQVVAMAALEPLAVADVLRIARRAYPYRDLTTEALESVLELVSGRFPSEAARDLQARVSWDRIHNRLHPLPGTQRVALVNGGTIPDTGQFAAYIEGTTVRIGELDEEFVYERRLGDVFLLGTTAWRINAIETDRVYVRRAEGGTAIMPFWRGEKVARSPDLGAAMGRFNQELIEHLRRGDVNATQDWLVDECRLDRAAACDLVRYARRQIERAGMLPTHEHLLVESFRDPLGDWYLAILSPVGTRFHFALRLAVEAYWQRRFGYRPACLHHDDGLLIKIVDMDTPPLDLLAQLPLETLENDILNELANSALFAIRFRHNAARSLLLTKNQPDRRAPLWLQRLKAKNLLQICRQYPRFPVVLETYRECLHDHLDVPRVRAYLMGLRNGSTHQTRLESETPSPFGGSLLFGFQAAFMYEYDKVAAENAARPVDRELLDTLAPEALAHLLDPRAISRVDQRLRGDHALPRSPAELTEWLRRRGDVRHGEVPATLMNWLEELKAEERVVEIALPGVPEPNRWILAEERPHYEAAFRLSGDTAGAAAAAERILRRFLTTHALVGLADVLERYPFTRSWVEGQLQAWTRAGAAVALQPQADVPTLQWAAPANLEEVQRTALALRRRETTTLPFHRYVDFVLRWQFCHPTTQRHGSAGLAEILERFRGWLLPKEVWESAVLPTRLKDYQPRWLDEHTQSGAWTWVGAGSDSDLQQIAFLRREELPAFRAPTAEVPAVAGPVYEALRAYGASFAVDLARQTALPPSRVRGALWHLVRLGLATNDRFDLARRGEVKEDGLEDPGPVRRLSLRNLKRQRIHQPEGRWSLVGWGMPDTDALALHQVAMLLDRFGIITRDVAQTDPWLLPWRVLYDVLGRLEMAGEVRRGYFVEGLSGAQFALPEAVRQWTDLGVMPSADEPAILLNSLDPANVIPFQSNQPDPDAGENPEMVAPRRRAGTWLVLRGGKVILTVEGMGKRITPETHATLADLEVGVASVKQLIRIGGLRARVTVEEWAGKPVLASSGRPLLEAAGFVRDYQALTLHAAWS